MGIPKKIDKLRNMTMEYFETMVTIVEGQTDEFQSD